MKERTYNIQKNNQQSLFTSNRELLYPKLEEIARYGDRVRESPRRILPLTNSLLEIARELEATLHIAKIKEKYLLTNGDNFKIKDKTLSSLLTMIWKYCEPIDTESVAIVYEKLEIIECWVKEQWAELLLIVQGEEQY